MRSGTALFAFALACGGKAKPPPPPLPVEIVVAKPTLVRDETEYLAELRPRTAITLQPQIEGRVTEIHVKSGDHVTTGQLLVSIDPGPQAAAVTRARSTKEARAAQLRLAEINLARQRALYASGATPRSAVDDAETQVASARNDVKALGAEVTGSRAQLSYYGIEAPAPGVVGDIPVRVGELVTPTTRITSVTDNSVLEANIAVPVDRTPDLELGTVVRVVDPAARELATGEVSFIAPQVDPATQVVLIKAKIDNRAGKLRAEQLARTRVVWRTFQGLTVPGLAVVRIGGQPFVFVAEPADGGWVAKQRPVTLGEPTATTFAVEKGLTAGDRIVVSQIQKLRDGAPINPVER